MLKLLKKNKEMIASAMRLVREEFCDSCRKDVAKFKCVRQERLCDDCKKLVEERWLK